MGSVEFKQGDSFLKENRIPVALREMVTVAQLVRASDCGSEGRGFETPQSPLAAVALAKAALFILKPFVCGMYMSCDARMENFIKVAL